MPTHPAHDLLDFYVVEATEYIDRIDAMVTRAGTVAPDGQSLVSAARALRGSSTMAKAEGMARDARAKAEDLQRRGQVVLEEQKARLDAAVEAAKAPHTKRS